MDAFMKSRAVFVIITSSDTDNIAIHVLDGETEIYEAQEMRMVLFRETPQGYLWQRAVLSPVQNTLKKYTILSLKI